MISRLPHWVLTDKHPAFYDSESKTCIEMTARVYAKMQEMIDEYNKFVEPLNLQINEFYNEIRESYECFKAEMIKIQHDYIMTVDEKMKMQDLTIQNYINFINERMVNQEELIEQKAEAQRLINEAFFELVNGKIETQDLKVQEAIDYMKTNIRQITQEVTTELLMNGQISIEHTYFPESKKLVLLIANTITIYDSDSKQLNIITELEE